MSLFASVRRASRPTKFFIGWYVLMVFWWLALAAGGVGAYVQNDAYRLVLVLIPLVGGAVGIYQSIGWGFLQSAMGRATLFVSAGLMAWGIGEAIAVAPFGPSMADVVSLSRYPLWMIGLFYISQVIGVTFFLREWRGRAVLVLGSVVAVLVSSYFQIIVARGGALHLTENLPTVVADLSNATGAILLMTLVLLLIVLSYDQLGGRYQWPILILLFGFLVHDAANFASVWQTTYYLSDITSVIDLLDATSVTALALGLAELNPYRDAS